MNKIAAFSPFHQAVSVVLLLLFCIAIIPNLQAQVSGITSILDLQYPSQAALQNGEAQVTVTFTVYYNYYYNPQGYLVFGVYDTGASNYVKGSATATPDQCQKLAGGQYTDAALCAIVPSSNSGSESAVFTLAFNSPQVYALSAVSLIWDTRNLQSGSQVSGSASKSDFTISVTGQTVSTSSTTTSSFTTSSTAISSTSSATATTSLTTSTTASSTTSSPSVQSSLDNMMLLTVIVLVVVLAAVIVFVASRRRNARPRKTNAVEGQETQKPSRSFCTNCGARLPEGYRFCGKCGERQQ
jgi:hypothetical protein